MIFKIIYLEDTPNYATEVQSRTVGKPRPLLPKLPTSKLLISTKARFLNVEDKNNSELKQEQLSKKYPRTFVKAEVEVEHYKYAEDILLDIQEKKINEDTVDSFLLDNQIITGPEGPGIINGIVLIRILQATKDELIKELEALTTQTTTLLTQDKIDALKIRRSTFDYAKLLTQLIKNPLNHIHKIMISSDNRESLNLPSGVDYTSEKSGSDLHTKYSNPESPFEAASVQTKFSVPKSLSSYGTSLETRSKRKKKENKENKKNSKKRMTPEGSLSDPIGMTLNLSNLVGNNPDSVLTPTNVYDGGSRPRFFSSASPSSISSTATTISSPNSETPSSGSTITFGLKNLSILSNSNTTTSPKTGDSSSPTTDITKKPSTST